MITCKNNVRWVRCQLISRSRHKKICSLPARPWTRFSAWLGEEECLPYQRAGSTVRLAPRPNCVFGLPHQILQHQSQISPCWFTFQLDQAVVLKRLGKNKSGSLGARSWGEITYAIYKQPRTLLFDELFNCVLQTIYCGGAQEAPTLSFSEGREPLVPVEGGRQLYH